MLHPRTYLPPRYHLLRALIRLFTLVVATVFPTVDATPRVGDVVRVYRRTLFWTLILNVNPFATTSFLSDVGWYAVGDTRTVYYWWWCYCPAPHPTLMRLIHLHTATHTTTLPRWWLPHRTTPRYHTTPTFDPLTHVSHHPATPAGRGYFPLHTAVV